MQGVLSIHAKVRVELDEENTLDTKQESGHVLSPLFALQAQTVVYSQ
jgi:hypothetical protein